jgi:hypothetical protein
MVETRSQRKASSSYDATSSSTPTTSSNQNQTPIISNATTQTNGSTSNSNSNKNSVTSAAAAATDLDLDLDPADIVKTPTLTIVSFILIAAISVFTYPDTLQPVGKPTVNHVWYFGWISALSTGLGVLPLVFSPDFNTFWVGVTNGKNIYMMTID